MQLYLEHNTWYRSTAVWNLKPEWCGLPLVQEKYQEENSCDDDDSIGVY